MEGGGLAYLNLRKYKAVSELYGTNSEMDVVKGAI